MGTVALCRFGDDLELRPSGAVALPEGIDASILRRTIDDPLGVRASDAELLADFADFMWGGAELFGDGPTFAVDPGFRERLRGRLWRAHVRAHLRHTRDVH